ncbi:hypothetical protein A9Q84_05525 [Halobacteriovorax marinus]|uniref:Carrier domain-containing protein n=1 Tax=Halobacteriovorax marinus TaxID=97084 RepID=A0A1Y5FGR9_9BACT|nr:hypothetical protein A9Q84_05525 [Halobacteriovorax marinus]
MEKKEQLIKLIQEELIDATGLFDVTPEQIDNDELIFGGEGALELDSLDALELVMILEKNFNVKINGKSASRKVFKSFNTVGDFILENSSSEDLATYLK